MRSKPLIAALCAMGLVLAAVFVLREAGRGGVAPREAVDVAPAPREVVLATPPATRRARAPTSAREPVSDVARVGDPSTPVPDASLGSGTILAALHGVLRREDGSPAPRVELRFLFEGGAAEAMTDESGVFTTAVVAPPGIVDVSVSGGVRPPRCSPELEPRRILVPADAPPPDVVLTLLRPSAKIEVLVTHAGVPTEASVEVKPRRLRAKFPQEGPKLPRTDEQGRLRISLCALEEGGSLALRAREGELESPWEPLLAPWPEVVQLELQPTVGLRVRVVDPGGRPIRGVLVELGREDENYTNDQGEARFRVGLGPQRVRIDGRARQREWLHVDVESFEEAYLEHVLVPSAERLLAAGRVVDEQGVACAHVYVRAQQGRFWYGAVTGVDGSFAVLGEEASAPLPVVVTLVGSTDGAGFDPERHVFDPGQHVVPAGSSDLLFVRRAEPATVELALALQDPGGALLPRGRVTFFLDGHAGLGMHGVKGGLLEVEVSPYEGLRALLRAPGHRDRVLDWAELSAATDPQEPLRVTLEPGLELGVRVLDHATHEPIAGAEILDGDELLAVTGADGRARLRSARWPDVLHVVAAGRAENAVDLRALPGEPELLCTLARP